MNPAGSLVSRRLHVHRLAGGRAATPEATTAWLTGVQAQDYGGGKWSIGLRTEGVRDADIEKAIAQHRIVRTWMFRGTLHFLSAADLGWLTTLLAPGILRGNQRRYGQLELDGPVFVKSQAVIRKAIEADGPLTRPELKKHFEAAGVPAEGQQVPYLLQRAALDGLICSGPLRGREPVYGLVEEWLSTVETIDRTEALGRLAGRYFASHGPATETDFAWWAGLNQGDVRKALEAAPEVEKLEIAGKPYLAAGKLPARASARQAYLLPPFDDYLLGYKDRTAVLDPQYAKRVNTGGGMPRPVVIVDGEVVGIWRRKANEGALEIEVETFRQLDAEDGSLIEQSAGRFGNFESTPVRTPVNFVR